MIYSCCKTFVFYNNTFGFCPVTEDTFNIDRNLIYEQQARDAWVTLLAIHNLALNILGSNVLGYMPGISLYSGSCRILTGLSLLSITLKYGERSAENGIIIKRFYDEAVVTAVSQVARGILEAFVPGGLVATAALDALSPIAALICDPGKYIQDGRPGDIPPPRRPQDPYPNTALADLCMVVNALFVLCRSVVLLAYLGTRTEAHPPIVYRYRFQNGTVVPIG